MKKIPVLPVLLLALMTSTMLNILFSTKTQALYLDENGIEWWSVEELLEFSKQIDAEEQVTCGNSLSYCEQLFFDKAKSNPKYRALYLFREERFLITLINPQKEELEVFYSDEEQMFKRWKLEGKQPLEHIFLAWLNEPNDQIWNYNRNFPAGPQFSDDLHTLYVGDVENFPVNTLLSLPIEKTNLSSNQLGRIYIAVFGFQFNAKGSTNYSSCLNDSLYMPGETCKVAFSADFGSTYFPSIKFKNQNPTPEEPTENNIIESISDETVTTANNKLVPEIQENNVTARTQNQYIKTPNTGSPTTTADNVKIDFPWWLGVILGLNGLVLIWLFLPTGIEKPKKPKKSLDKIKRLR